eukprot:GDKK01067441.1.p1 GENE.GDKK01067441.1~~GDKK01067441.1.p1  ORF type:complete len:207 (-),score=29.54 GDKK01067441.1:73-693(-)
MGARQSTAKSKAEKNEKNDRTLAPDAEYWDREIAPYLLCYLKELMESVQRPENVKIWMHERLKRDLDVQQTVNRRHFVCAVQRAKEQMTMHTEIISELDIKIILLQKEIRETSNLIEKLQTVERGTKTNPYAELQSSIERFNRERSNFTKSLKMHPLLKVAGDKKIAKNELSTYFNAMNVQVPDNYFDDMKRLPSPLPLVEVPARK